VLLLVLLVRAPALKTLVDEDCRGCREYKRASTSQRHHSWLLIHIPSQAHSHHKVFILRFVARSDRSYGSKEDYYLSAFQIAQARSPLDPQIQIRGPSPHHPQPGPFLARSTSSDCLKSSSLPHSSHTTSNLLLRLFARYFLLPRRTDILHHVCQS
jgi:hypothetical protein